MVQSAPPDEQGLRDKLTISGLSSALKAEKRVELAKNLADVADVRVETELKIGREGKNGSKEHTLATRSLGGETCQGLRHQLAVQILRYVVLDGLNSFRVFLLDARRAFQLAKSMAFSVTRVAPARRASSAISRSPQCQTTYISPNALVASEAEVNASIEQEGTSRQRNHFFFVGARPKTSSGPPSLRRICSAWRPASTARRSSITRLTASELLRDWRALRSRCTFPTSSKRFVRVNAARPMVNPRCVCAS